MIAINHELVASYFKATENGLWFHCYNKGTISFVSLKRFLFEILTTDTFNNTTGYDVKKHCCTPVEPLLPHSQFFAERPIGFVLTLNSSKHCYFLSRRWDRDSLAPEIPLGAPPRHSYVNDGTVAFFLRSTGVTMCFTSYRGK